MAREHFKFLRDQKIYKFFLFIKNPFQKHETNFFKLEERRGTFFT